MITEQFEDLTKKERLKHRSKKLIKSHVHWDSPNKESKKGNWAKGGRDYMDDTYQKQLAARIDTYMEDIGLTFKQAFNKAYKEVKPPSVTVPFMSYADWRKQFTGEM